MLVDMAPNIKHIKISQLRNHWPQIDLCRIDCVTSEFFKTITVPAAYRDKATGGEAPTDYFEAFDDDDGGPDYLPDIPDLPVAGG